MKNTSVIIAFFALAIGLLSNISKEHVDYEFDYHNLTSAELLSNIKSSIDNRITNYNHIHYFAMNERNKRIWSNRILTGTYHRTKEAYNIIMKDTIDTDMIKDDSTITIYQLPALEDYLQGNSGYISKFTFKERIGDRRKVLYSIKPVNDISYPRTKTSLVPLRTTLSEIVEAKEMDKKIKENDRITERGLLVTFGDDTLIYIP